MTTGRTYHPTWSRMGLAVSLGLVIFGVVDATLPNSSVAAMGPQTNPHVRADGATKSAVTTSMGSANETAARRVAQQFVTATDTTDRADPEGDTAELARLAPNLAAPPGLTWPEAWAAEDRRTTVTLDPAGPAVRFGTGRVAIVVTGRMDVTTDTGPPTEVPVDERITLEQIRSAAAVPHWVVTDVGTGS